ncbi:MAG: phytoene dehydrogenase [Flavobacteriales bacterium]|nr:phytoene dehydrogenase [Flavobacteriales bacterium]
MKKVGVIGSGFSSLTAAIELASMGFDVEVFEKNETLGGRARHFKEEGFVFDMGPSWYWMPDVFEDFFARHGKKVEEYYDLIKLDPGFSIYYDDGEKLEIPESFNALVDTFENIESGSGDKLQHFMKRAEKKYEIGVKNLVYKPSKSIFEFINLKVIKGSFYLDIFTVFSKYVRKYFKHEKLIKLMEFPILFLGSLPSNTPAMYSLMNYSGLKQGTYYPIGGFYKIIEALVGLAKEKGVSFSCSSEVQKINVTNGKVCSLLVNNQNLPIDIVVAGADYHHVDSKLLEPKFRNYTNDYWNSRKLAPSCLLFYLGLNKKLKNVNHHTLFFDKDFSKHAKEIYETPKWPNEPLFYMSCPSVSDDSVAPKGMENIMLLIPLAPDLKDSNEMREKYFLIMLERLNQLTGNDISDSIVYKKSYCVSDFIKDYNAFKGNAYGLANTLDQTAILKPSLRNKKLKNLFYTGQLTVPGPGVPPSIISGQVVANEINKYF